MIGVTIRIQSKADAERGVPAIEGITSPDDFTYLKLKTVAILEGGMQSGKTSLMFHLVDAGGKQYIAETSADIFRSAVGALNGAEERWR